jgi:SpoVK/Ycf46/Vps4 family AAA+-type ATPase
LCDKQKEESTDVSRINVLVATTSADLKAEVIAESVAIRPDMILVENRTVAVAEVDSVLDSLTEHVGCALVIVGSSTETDELAQRWLAKRSNLVVLHVDVVGDYVRMGLRDPRLDPLLTTLRELVDRFGTERTRRVAHFQISTQRPLLQAAINWVHALLRDAVGRIPDDNGDVHGLSVTRATLLQSLDETFEHIPNNYEIEAALDREFASKETNQEPIAVAATVSKLKPLEFRLMALALAPELDFRFQRCLGFLLDDMSRRVGTLGLYCSLLGLTANVREDLTEAGALTRWFVFDDYLGRPPAADEPLKIDPFLTQWLLGDSTALSNDPRVRRALHLSAWPGVDLLTRTEGRLDADAEQLMKKVHGPGKTPWVLLGGKNAAEWRALLELGAHNRHLRLIRVEPTSLAGVDKVEVEECAKKIGRMTRLTGNPLAIDLTRAEGVEWEDDRIQLFLETLNRTDCRAAVICAEPARIVRLLGSVPDKLLAPCELSVSYELMEGQVLSMPARIAAVRAAAKGADAYLTEESAEAIANRYPLQVGGLEHAMHLAARRPKNFNADDPAGARFTEACRELVSEGLSHLAERIEPIFSLDNVVLSPDRKEQLFEIVDHVRLAPKVLDGWKFRDQLPYGQGVTALFFGPSGTGKTMAAMGVARRLDIQVLRIDLSRVVSKYIGDTEKNIDRVFEDAQRSGSAILIDEADALLGKRSEVKDAHDRYANIEVAYLLQRLEAYDGLAILTTNMRQNIDAAFLRRLRFIVDFPRPDAAAREKIWRQCLPAESHELDDADYRQLARKIELTGGHIRQITLRAAFIAATADMLINIQHIAQAMRAEFAKIGMPPVELDIAKRRIAA